MCRSLSQADERGSLSATSVAGSDAIDSARQANGTVPLVTAAVRALELVQSTDDGETALRAAATAAMVAVGVAIKAVVRDKVALLQLHGTSVRDVLLRVAPDCDGTLEWQGADVAQWLFDELGLWRGAARLVSQLDVVSSDPHAGQKWAALRRPVQSKIRVPLFAARTLNYAGQYRVTLSLR